MACQAPNPIETSPRIQRWGKALEKYSSFLTFKYLMATTILFIVSGYAGVAFLLNHPEAKMYKAIPFIQLGNAFLFFIALYFLVVEFLFRKRPQAVKLILRFVWYVAILFIESSIGILALIVAA